MCRNRPTPSLLFQSRNPLCCDPVTTTPPQPAAIRTLKKIKGTLPRALRPQHQHRSPLWVLKGETHCVACLASSVGGGGRVSQGGQAHRREAAGREWGPRQSEALGRWHFHLVLEEEALARGGRTAAQRPSVPPAHPVTPLPRGPRRQGRELGLCHWNVLPTPATALWLRVADGITDYHD